MSQPAFPGRLTPDDPDLSERQKRIFGALVGLHGTMARPVSSELLAQQEDIAVSSASVRAELSELESLGLVERSHSSAGRVPTARGFSLYVRTLLTPAELDPWVVAEVGRTLSHSERDVRQLLDEASRLLSTLTHQLGLALAVSLSGEILRGLDLAPLDEHRALLVLNIGAETLRTLVLELGSRLDREQLDEVASVLRERLLGRTLAEVRDRLDNDPELVRKSAVRIVARAAAASWERPVATPLFHAGAMHIAEQPEFARAPAAILRAVEARSPLDRLLVTGVEGQAAARVSLDEDAALAGCSLVAYALPGRVRGAVGVLGPMRMDYALAFAVVEAVGARVTEILES